MAKNDIKNFYKNNNVSDEELTDFIKYNQDNKISVNLKNDRKIDLVYLWCDASDEQFREKKDYWLKKDEKIKSDFDSQSKHDARFRSFDELRYSLRSVEKFIPWINHIYIVTDNQVPHWLDTKHPKITIVDHKDIIPKEYLPTFNSDVIACFVPYIKELSEYYLVSDDDCFINDYLKPSYFFTNDGKPIVNVKKLNIHDNPTWQKKVSRLNKLFNDKFKTDYNIELSHNVSPRRKSYILMNLQDKNFKNAFLNLFTHKFRKYEDVNIFLFYLYDNLKHRNILRMAHKHNRNVNIFRGLYNWIFKKYYYEFLYISNNVIDILEKNPKLFCINDEPSITEEDRAKNQQFLEQYFNVKSSFER